MKRLFSIVGLLTLTSSIGQAQKAFIYNRLQKNGFLSVSMGTSLPTGDFGQLTVCPETVNRNGLALSGRVWNLSAGYRLGGPLGLMARYETVQHGVQPAALTSLYSQVAGDVLQAVVPTGRAGQWQSSSLLLGPFVTIPLGRLALDFRALAGQAWATCPETCVQGTLKAVETAVRSQNQTSTAIASGLGTSLRYRLTPIVALHANADYSAASFRFNDIPLESRSGDVTNRTTYSAVRTLSMVNLTAGVTLQFCSKNRVF